LPLIRAELQRRRLPRPGPLLHDLSQVLYLPFDHDDGSYARDRSGYNNHGTIYGATLATGKIGMARSFDGVDDRVEVPHSPSLNITGDKITIRAWFKTTNPNKEMFILSKGPAWGGVYNLAIRTDLNRVVFRVVIGGAVKEYAYTKIGMADGKLHYVVSKYDGAFMRIFYDLTELGPGLAVTGNIDSNTEPVHIGEAWGFHFDGVIDEIGIDKIDRTQAELQRLMYLRGI